MPLYHRRHSHPSTSRQKCPFQSIPTHRRQSKHMRCDFSQSLESHIVSISLYHLSLRLPSLSTITISPYDYHLSLYDYHLSQTILSFSDYFYLSLSVWTSNAHPSRFILLPYLQYKYLHLLYHAQAPHMGAICTNILLSATKRGLRLPRTEERSFESVKI